MGFTVKFLCMRALGLAPTHSPYSFFFSAPPHFPRSPLTSAGFSPTPNPSFPGHLLKRENSVRDKKWEATEKVPEERLPGAL